jgi:hypothetical protein
MIVTSIFVATNKKNLDNSYLSILNTKFHIKQILNYRYKKDYYLIIILISIKYDLRNIIWIKIYIFLN